MKKGITSLLLLLVLVATVQPTVALHFCGGHFHSIAIGSPRKSCCGEAMKGCCSTYTIEITTDHFQLPDQTPDLKAESLIIQPVVFLTDIIRIYTITTSSLIQTVFPPGQLVQSGMEILIRICILLI
jgi:hypothetical protein